MTLNNDSINQLLLTAAKYQKQVNLLLVVLLSVYLLAYAAHLTWMLIPSPTSTGQQGAKQTNTSSIQQVNAGKADLAKLKRLNLFGKLGAKPKATQEPQLADAPKTRLNLTLSGVVSDKNPTRGAAIIGNRGKQSTYAAGEKIDGTNAVLQSVYPDRVIIRNGARNETLMLDGVDFTKSLAKPATTSLNTGRSKQSPPNTKLVRNRLTRDQAIATRKLKASPARFTDFIAISPYTAEGQLKGYRIAPGKDPKLFKSLGLKSGDVVVGINGLDLTNAQQAMQAMNALRDSESLQMNVNRKGDLITLQLDIPEED